MFYEKNNQYVEECDDFVYSEDIYLIYPLKAILFRSKSYTSKTPVKNKDSGTFNKEYGCKVQRYWELIAAPREYLIKKGYKPKYEK